MNRIKLIVCYYGKFPQWMNIWLKSCELNSDIDFMIVTDIKVDNLPSNVTILNMSFQELKKHFSDIFRFSVSLENPYKLCDYKPVYGKVFQKELEGYEFWGCCDIDLIWGRIRNFITDDILNDYDLIGKYGHLMIYRNNKEKMVNKWKQNISSSSNNSSNFHRNKLWNAKTRIITNRLKPRETIHINR